MTLDHVSVSIGDPKKSKDFYTKALAPLGIEMIADVGGDWYGFGKLGKPGFWFGPSSPKQLPTHIAFSADSRAQVDAFYKAAISAGWIDNGPPGLRTQYHPNYYAAFVIDPEGHNIEAVCHKPQ